MRLRIFVLLLETLFFETPRVTAVVDRGQSWQAHSESGQEPPECQHHRTTALTNYRNGNAHLLVYGITHGASTALHMLAEKNGFSEATGDRQHPFAGAPNRAVVHFWGESLQSGRNGPLPHSPLNEVMPCNSDNFVSLITMRHPIARILSGDGMFQVTATQNQDTCPTDNYAFRWITGTRPWTKINETDIALAKQRIDMFDIVLIVEEFNQTSRMICEELQWKDCMLQYADKHGPPEKRLPADVYQKLMQRNKPELELYEYARTRAHMLITQLPTKHSLIRRAPPAELGDKATFSYDSAASEGEKWVCDESLNPFAHKT